MPSKYHRVSRTQFVFSSFHKKPRGSYKLGQLHYYKLGQLLPINLTAKELIFLDIYYWGEVKITWGRKSMDRRSWKHNIEQRKPFSRLERKMTLEENLIK